ncbi:beta-lactamase-like protein [Astrocystis sublimbata]|nr:beta-lactamase-like protein [Astrocystis sublimbata]
MLNYVQLTTTPTADTNGTSLLLHFDDQRYVFGRVAEGTQRAFIQRKLTMSKVGNIFLSGRVQWDNVGGLFGFVLTIADILTSAGKLNGSKPNLPVPNLNIHAGKNITHMLATARRFIFRQGVPLRPLEVQHDSRATRACGTYDQEPDWKDDNINVWYMVVGADPKGSPNASSRKRSHEEFNQDSKHDTESDPLTATSSRDSEGLKLKETVVKQMFDSDWTIDALVETTLHRAALPAKLFVRENGHLQVYTGPMPGPGVEVPDIPVLVRQPWPSASVTSLPRTEPAEQSLCYIVKGRDRRGKFNRQAAVELGVEVTNFKHLANGQSVTGKDGNVVTPDMVLGETVTGAGFAIADLPDVSYINALVNRPEWADEKIMDGVKVIYWILGSGVVNDTRVQDFMQRMSSLKHVVTSPETSPNMIALESVATQAFKLRCIDADRFPLPAHSNELSISGTKITESPAYEIARTGKTVQFAPTYIHQDEKIVPFPDIEKLARNNFHPKVLDMAAKASRKINNRDWLAKVEKAEVDIPNRDAEIISLGTGSSAPSKYRNVSATLVRVPGFGNYLFDAGENTLGQLRRVFGDELPSVLRDLKVIWISHLHADHHLGTASVIKAWHEETSKDMPSAKLVVASHSHMLDWLVEYADVEEYGFKRLVLVSMNRKASDKASITLEPCIFDTEEKKAFGLEKIEACWVKHCYGSLATSFTFPSGLKISYSGDCRPSTDFARIGQGTTILIHESTFDDDMLSDAKAKKHSTMSEAIGVGRQMGARRILLTHFSQRYQKIPIMEQRFEIRPDATDEEKAKADEVILVAFDYMRVKLGEFRHAQAFLPTLQKLFEDPKNGMITNE